MKKHSDPTGLADISNRNESSSTSSSSRSTSVSQSQNSNFLSHSNHNFRSILLTECIEFKFDSNIAKYGIAVGDCDNDQKNELLVGTLNGELLIFKDASTVACASAKDLGMISCVLIDDLLNNGQNCVVSLSIEGYLNIFRMTNEQSADLHSTSLNPSSARRTITFSSSSAPNSAMKLPPTITDNEVFCSSIELNLIHSQQLQSNALSALIVDIDNDGQNEFIVALTDRVVRSYRAIQYGDEIKLVGIHKWEFSNQIGSITLSTNWKTRSDNNNEVERSKSVLVAQYGGLYAKLNCCDRGNEENNVLNVDNNGASNDPNSATDQLPLLKPEYVNVTMPSIRNPQMNAEIISDLVGSPNGVSENHKLVALASTDGILTLLNDDTVHWQCQLEPQVLSLNKHDIDNDGRDELIVCNWDGLTHIVDLDGQIVTCQFGQPVSAFTAANYDLYGRRMTCFVYATFTNSIHLYYNIDCSFTVDNSQNFVLKQITEHPPLNDKLKLLVRKLNQLNQSDTNDDDGSESTESPDSGDVIRYDIDANLIRTILYEIPM